MFTIYPITLNNNQNIHAELIGPSSSALNYDLRLYEMDVNTGTIGALVDICSYTKSATLAIPQTVATINRNSTAKNYALIVYAREGYSSTDTFDINITLGVGGDPAESNDNAFKAYSFGTLGVQGISVQGTNLDSQKDVDWFAFSAPNLSDFDKIRISNATNSNVKYQLYYVSNGTTLVEVQPTNGLYPIRTGMNYLRVTDNGNNFSASDVPYAPLISVSFKPSKMMSEVHMNEYVGIPAQTYKVWNANETSFWPKKRNTLLSGCKLEWKATFLSFSGYLCPDAKNALHIRTTNTSWAPIQFQSANADGNPAENGVATCVLPKSVGCRGVYSGVSGMSYDVACTLSMWADGFPAIISGPAFVTSRIMT